MPPAPFKKAWLPFNLWEFRFYSNDHPKEVGLNNCVKLRQFALEDEWHTYLRLDFLSTDDMLYFRDLVTPYCLISWPEISKDFQVIGRLGVGSQASVDHYRRRSNEKANDVMKS
jgi:hypothetical protein